MIKPIRMRSNFTYYEFPFINGVILGFFDKGESDLLKDDLDIIIEGLRKNEIKTYKNRSTYIKYNNFEIIEFNSYNILIYNEGKAIKWNGTIHMIGLYMALKRYIALADRCLCNYVCSLGDLESEYIFCDSYENEAIEYLSVSLNLFGPKIFDIKGEIHNRLYKDISYRAYRNACMKLNKGFKNYEKDTPVTLPSRTEFTEEKDKLVRRISRHSILATYVL